MLLLLGGCLVNDAHELRDANSNARPGHATVVFAVKDARYSAGDTGVSLQLDHFSLEQGKITGDCFNYDRLQAERVVGPSTNAYFVFSAPPGHYVVSPFSGVYPSINFAFFAPADAVTYFGDFIEVPNPEKAGAGSLARTEDLPSAVAFAASRGLAEPQNAKMAPVADRGPIFVCTP